MNQKLKHNIILIGFMGSGKTSVGERLAELLSYRFRDMDHIIEQNTHDTINHIFEAQGEEYFRNLETLLLKELLPTIDQTVLSTGGGLPLREQNARLIKEMGYVVYLRVSKESVMERLKGDTTRPLLKGDELERKVDHLLSTREPIYERAAHRIIATDDKSVEAIVHLIMESYMKMIY
ncbi:MAG: shikimate kinase [Mobilitalea sp.]